MLLNNWQITDKFKNALSDYLKIISELNPDLIQIFGLESPFIRIIKEVKQPIILHMQGLLPSILFKYSQRFNVFEILKSNGIKNNIAGKIPFIDKKEIKKQIKHEEKTYHYIKYCLGRTDWDRRCIKALAPQAKYFYCQEIMRKDFYSSVWYPPKNEKWIIYTTLRDKPYKNVAIIYETCSIMAKYQNEFRYEWLIAGVNEEDLTPQVMKQRKKGSHNIRLLGDLSIKEIINEIQKANIFVYPSAIENSSNAVQEAMLLGIPIISSFAGGLGTLIEDKETGIMVNEGDPYALAGAILEMIEKYDEAIELGKKARKVALERNDPQKITSNLLDIYEQELSSN